MSFSYKSLFVLMSMNVNLRPFILGSFLSSLIFLIGAVFTYNFRSTSQGLLPIINYPFREQSSSFLIISTVLFIIGLISSAISYYIGAEDSK